MANVTFNNLDDLQKYLQGEINDILLGKVSDVVRDQLQTGVKDVVYAAGDPKKYIRRNLKDGSLGDKDTMISGLVENGLLKMILNADYNRNYNDDTSTYPGITLAYNIEYGYGNKSEWWNVGRPFVQKSIDNLRDNKRHVKAMKDELKRRFENVK